MFALLLLPIAPGCSDGRVDTCHNSGFREGQSNGEGLHMDCAPGDPGAFYGDPPEWAGPYPSSYCEAEGNASAHRLGFDEGFMYSYCTYENVDCPDLLDEYCSSWVQDFTVDDDGHYHE